MGRAKLKLPLAGGLAARVDLVYNPSHRPATLGACGALKRLTLRWGGSCCRWRGRARKLSRNGMPGGRAGPRALGAPLQQHEGESPDLFAFFFSSLFLLSCTYIHACMLLGPLQDRRVV